MTVTVATLADRALRRLGVVIVTEADRPANTATVSVADIAAQALRNLGVIVTKAERPTIVSTVSTQVIAASALQRLGVIVPEADRFTVMTPIARADVCRRALEMLAVFAPDETPLTADMATADAALSALTNSMLERGLIYWDPDNIPEPTSEDFTQLLSVYLAPSFGKTGDVAQRPVIEARIARVSLVHGAQAMAEAKVRDINDSLITRGIVDWTTVPSAAAEEYIQMAASELAPVFGQEPADPALRPAFEARIAHISLVKRSQALAEDQVAQIQASMVARGIVSWSAIPASVADQYIGMTEIALSPMFGKPDDPKEFLALEARVRQVSVIARAPDDAYEAVMAVHTDLVGRGIARWSSQDIPEMAAMPYEMLAAYELAPKFPPAEQDKAEYLQAMRSLFALTALPTSGERVVAEYF